MRLRSKLNYEHNPEQKYIKAEKVKIRLENEEKKGKQMLEYYLFSYQIQL